MFENINNISGILIGLGTLFSVFSLKIISSEIETIFIKGKPCKSALITINRPFLLNFGLVLLSIGYIVQILINIYNLVY